MKIFPQFKLPVVYCLTVILSCLSAVSLEGAKEATQEEIENIALAIPDKIEPLKNTRSWFSPRPLLTTTARSR